MKQKAGITGESPVSVYHCPIILSLFDYEKNTYISIIRTLGCLLLLSVFVSSCLYEEPELTADGELGVDPTAVNIMTNLTLETSFDPVNVNRGTRAAATTYLHRFVVAVYEGSQK